MPESNESLQIRLDHIKEAVDTHVRDCNERARQNRLDKIEDRKYLEKLIEKLDKWVELDQNIKAVALHVERLEGTVADYAEVKQNATQAANAMNWVNRLIIGAVISALLGMIFLK